jgi:hypothetical protein
MMKIKEGDGAHLAQIIVTKTFITTTLDPVKNT